MEHYKEINRFLESSSFFYTIAIDINGNYSYVSSNYDKNFDFVKDSLLSKPFSITLHPDDIKICEDVGRKCFENPGKLLPATLRKHNGKGGYVFTQWELQAMFDKSGIPEGIFCIGYNITEHINSKIELDGAKMEIASKNDKLNEISFLQSHVVRKPLANIMGLSSILSSMVTDVNFKNINELMISSANELDKAIKDITEVSNID